MDHPLTDVSQATPMWLESRLRARGHLQGGAGVSALSLGPRLDSTGDVSVVRLDVVYEGTVTLPRELILKVGGSSECVDLEAWFHNDVVPNMDSSPTAMCFDAATDWDSGRAHVLFEDLTGTHYHATDGLRDNLRSESEAIVDAYARVHAFWWGHPWLGKKYGAFPDEDRILWYQGKRSYEERLPEFLALAGDRLAPRDRTILQKALHSFPLRDLRGRSRLRRKDALTILHADVKHDNILLPRDPSRDSVRLIDWSYWEIRQGTDDIAALGICDFAEPSVGLTEDLVRRYYDRLRENGVTRYAWEECWHDYRLSTVRQVLAPVTPALHGTPLDYCLMKLGRAMRSFEALNCEEVIGR